MVIFILQIRIKVYTNQYDIIFSFLPLHVKMGNKDGKALLPHARHSWPPLPQKVQVLYNGQMKEMTKTSPGQWETDSWTYVKLSTFYDPIGYYSRNRKEYAVFQLTLEFKDTRFAEGERQVLTHLSKLRDTQ
jgi:hypothetical protein